MYRDQVLGWIDRTSKNPNDLEVLKKLSVYYVQTHDKEKASYYLNKALEEKPDDPELIFYKGLNLEFYEKLEEAISYYSKFQDVYEDSPYRELLEGRYNWLKRQKDYADVKSLIQDEKEISSKDGSDSTMAVFPLIYHGINADYFPLSRGFSEMFSIDLAKLKEITVLERVRIQAVLDELKLNQSAVVDKSSAPRVGKILQAGTIVSGDYDISDNGELKINLGSWKVRDNERKSWVKKSGSLEDLFVLQKQVVFEFLKENGFQLTQEEKEKIAYIPTQNLEAFLTYSKGLLQEDAGNFRQAEGFFKQAVGLDPKFIDAGSKLKTSKSISKSGGSKESTVKTLRNTLPAVKNEMIDLAASRMQNLGNNITSNFVIGIDSRNPARELSEAVELNQPLNDPPPPPPPPIGK